MRLSAVSAVVAFFVSLTASQSTGQSIIPSTLPSCAQSCQILTLAQNACTAPPNAPAGGTYGLPCLCQSAFLGPLKSSAPSNICATCSTTDNAAIQSWFQGACKNGGTGGTTVAAGSNPQTTLSSSKATVAPAAATPTNSGATVNGQPAANTLNVAQKGWMSTHWRWVVMLIVLVLGFIGLAIGGVYFKRYIHRRREAEESRLAGPRQDLETWGPGHSVHDINAVGSGMAPSPNEKGKGREMVQTQESTESPRDNRRLKKGWLPGRG